MPRPSVRAVPLLGTLLLAAAVACEVDRGDGSGSDVAALAPPSAPGSGQPRLSSGPDGEVLLSWLAPAAEGHALRYSRLGSSGWGAARTVATGDRFFVNWADFPSVVPLGAGRLAAHWLEVSGEGRYAYDVRLALSADGGRSWRGPVTPHRDGTETEHGFVSLFPLEDGRLGAVWLDGRDYARGETPPVAGSAAGADVRAEEPGPVGAAVPEGSEMALRFAAVDGEGGIVEEALLDSRVCDCCSTAAARTSRGVLVLYRDRSGSEVRDIASVERTGIGWSRPRPLHDDGWTIPACPVNGPAVDARGGNVVVAWYTAEGEEPRVLVAFSGDAGRRFGRPVRADDGTPLGRVGVALLPGGGAAVSWLERRGEAAEVRVRIARRTGLAAPSRLVASSSAARASGFPQMAVAGDRLLFAWTEAGDPGRIRTAALALEEAGASR